MEHMMKVIKDIKLENGLKLAICFGFIQALFMRENIKKGKKLGFGMFIKIKDHKCKFL